MTDGTDRYERGLATLRRVGGPEYAAPLDALRELAPDLARWTVEFAYGDVMARPALDLRARQICTVAALTAMGNARPQLEYHVAGALNVGWSVPEIVETTILTTVYAGFPAALNGVAAVRAVVERRGERARTGPVQGGADGPETQRYERGLRALERVSGSAGRAVLRGLEEVAPDLARFIVEFSYGDVIARPGLDLRTKELATVAMLTALGTAHPQLEVHVRAATNVGCSRAEVLEAIQQMAVYAGFPAALNGIAAARAAFSAPPVPVR